MMNEYEGKLEINLSVSVTVKALNRADGKEKLGPLQEKLVEFLRSQEEVDGVFERCFRSYVYTDENWKPTPYHNDEWYLVFADGGDRDYFEEYYDDETRIEGAVQQSLENELELLKEIEVGEMWDAETGQELDEKDYYETE